MRPISIFTIGYEDKSIEDFLARLKKHKITVLVDIREKPISRKKGFSKTKINDHLQSVGIKYIHMGALGSPSKLRDKLHRDNNYDYFFKEYKKHLDALSEPVEDLYREILSKNVICLMCMERDPLQCHRLLVAKKIKEINGKGLTITHI
jgi:uncharacterized protein (DUF488 family)